MNIKERNNNEQTKEITAWAIYDRDYIMPSFVDFTPQGAFCYFLNMENQVRGESVSWEELQAEGYSCRKILIKEIK